MTRPGGAATGPGDEAVRRWLDSRARATAAREATLASDAEREKVCELLNSAFGEGRLTSTELDVRTSQALAARTHGELQDVLAGLAGPGTSVLWSPQADRGIVPRIVFWVVGLFTSPFVLFGTMFVLFGDDLGDRIAGIVMLVLFLPGLIALYRWAHPRG
jgi:NAD(P)-dependent dehydrogenase (short-subunit alcohol dehydrogenase family)